ncbi:MULTISPECIES: family 16 glycosylhydrolase [Methylobacterium]|jgi:endo-1,3-1,4-beta-glycanase ExoK|uniref:Beta-glucanase n=1 Tax=Methylobacterium phyllosphaerae TaxID=418223 RepID=A0AAE8L5L3_9HYPH|nr:MULTISPECIES: family 16 glycosylhydrolase [Methylobacterium]KOX56177.1 glycoside hydrolase [Streptomyces purpurogeneiscleroticus]APT33402.1 endo-1,3-1,4-beta-glycanase ExoK [Methylobacterium phyllosphaerae]MBP33898.1 glycoside hydrolase [Methylobacterium sp.]MDE4910797.1 family 16 glycosylhydrolase [Methylobacterium sp. 092160098-2]MDH3030426.1 family 16 glycosylhydrolase [Methylobacterium fujisawaense]
MTIWSGPVRRLCVAATLLLQAHPGSAGETAAPPAGAPAEQGGGSFVETFNTLSDRRWYISDGWANGDWQGCMWSKQRVRIAKPGELTLALANIAYKERPFSCAEIQTHERYGYGTYEVRMRPGAGSGMVSAFFTYNGPENGDRRTNDEIDFEFLGKDTGKVQLNYFVGGVGGHDSFDPLGFDAATATADYALEWLPDRLRWYVNGRLLREVRAAPDRPLPSHPGKIMLSVWSGQGQDFASWLGPTVYPGRPVTALFERVAFTRMGDPCGFKESIVCR